jgi:hypothetical protein
MSKEEIRKTIKEIKKVRYGKLAIYVNYTRWYADRKNLQINYLGEINEYAMYVLNEEGLMTTSVWERDITDLKFEVMK